MNLPQQFEDGRLGMLVPDLGEPFGGKGRSMAHGVIWILYKNTVYISPDSCDSLSNLGMKTVAKPRQSVLKVYAEVRQNQSKPAF